MIIHGTTTIEMIRKKKKENEITGMREERKKVFLITGIVT